MKQKKRVFTVLHYIILIILFFIFAFPTFFMILSSFKEDQTQLIGDMSSIKAFIPYGKIGFKNYIDLFHQINFFHFFWNSVVITGSTIIVGVVVNSMFAYSLSVLKFSAKKVLVPIVVALIIVPIQAIVIPMLLLVNSMDIVNTYLVQIIPFVANAFFVFLFYQFFRDIPKDLIEAAVVDGASYFRIYWQIVLPLSKPVIASVIIFNWLERWGDLLWPVMSTTGEKVRPLSLEMQALFTLQPRNWGEIFAYATMMTLPVLIIFILSQKYFIKSVASTGIKG